MTVTPWAVAALAEKIPCENDGMYNASISIMSTTRPSVSLRRTLAVPFFTEMLLVLTPSANSALWLEICIKVLEFCNVCDDVLRGSRGNREAFLLHSTHRGFFHHECERVILFIHRLLYLVSLSPSTVCIFIRGALTETTPLSLALVHSRAL